MLSGLFVPDTVDYMIAGYLVVGVMISGYIMSLVLRWRKTHQEYVYLREDQNSPKKAPPGAFFICFES